jgi:hypothetical protein
MTQTAVEWLFSQLPDHLRLSEDGFDTLQQAKAMEREQIIDAWNSAYGGDSHHEGKDFFEKTYGGAK